MSNNRFIFFLKIFPARVTAEEQKRKLMDKLLRALMLRTFFYNYSIHLMKAGCFKESSRCFTVYLHIFGSKDGMYSNIFVTAISCRLH